MIRLPMELKGDQTKYLNCTITKGIAIRVTKPSAEYVEKGYDNMIGVYNTEGEKARTLFTILTKPKNYNDKEGKEVKQSRGYLLGIFSVYIREVSEEDQKKGIVRQLIIDDVNLKDRIQYYAGGAKKNNSPSPSDWDSGPSNKEAKGETKQSSWE